jgi:hypothetical protein
MGRLFVGSCHITVETRRGFQGTSLALNRGVMQP